MWRPKEWDGYEGAHIALMNNNPWLEDEHTACYEAGANAMLEAVKCIGLNFTCYPFRMGSMDVFDYQQSLEGKSGWLVFIPEDKQ